MTKEVVLWTLSLALATLLSVGFIAIELIDYYL